MVYSQVAEAAVRVDIVSVLQSVRCAGDVAGTTVVCLARGSHGHFGNSHGDHRYSWRLLVYILRSIIALLEGLVCLDRLGSVLLFLREAAEACECAGAVELGVCGGQHACQYYYLDRQTIL